MTTHSLESLLDTVQTALGSAHHGLTVTDNVRASDDLKAKGYLVDNTSDLEAIEDGLDAVNIIILLVAQLKSQPSSRKGL